MARSTSRSARRNRGAAQAQAGNRGAGGAAPPAAGSQPSRSKAAPASPAGRLGGIDARWLIAGVTGLVVVIAIAISVFAGNRLGGGSGAGTGATVGQVTETAAGGAAPGMLSTGTSAPNLQWTLGGQAGSLAAERGHPVLLAFVATWCPHCQAEVAVLNKVQQRFAGQGLKVIGVTASPNGIDGRSRASLGDTELFV